MTRKINAIDISEESIAKIDKIAAAQNAGSAAAGEKESPGNMMIGKRRGNSA